MFVSERKNKVSIPGLLAYWLITDFATGSMFGVSPLAACSYDFKTTWVSDL